MGARIYANRPGVKVERTGTGHAALSHLFFSIAQPKPHHPLLFPSPPPPPPLPVYLTDEVVALATKSTSDTAATTLDFLLRKLAPGTTPIVKSKALKLLKACCTAGPSEFKRRAARTAAGPVRELTHWQAPPDPLVGDSHNARVRGAAKEALEAIFSAAPAPAPLSVGGAHGGGGSGARIQGFGSGSSSGRQADGGGGGAYAAPSSSGMIGFGNPRFENSTGSQAGHHQQPPNLATARGVLEAAARGAAALATQAAGAAVAMAAEHGINLAPLPTGGSGLGAGGLAASRPGGGLGGYGPPAFSSSSSSSYGAPGGYAGGGGGTTHRPGSSGLPSPYPSAGVPVPPPRLAAPGAREEALVDAVCAPGGLRAAPTPAELARFVDGTAAVDGPAMAAHLRARLASPAWHAQARALAALEALMTKGASASAGAVAVSFQADPAPVLAALNSSQASVRAVAGRVAGLLGVSVAGGVGAGAPKGASGGGGVDLLGDLLAPGAAAPAAAAVAAQPDLMGGFGGLDHVAAAAPAAAVSQAADLLGGLTMGAAHPPALPSTCPPAAADPFAAAAAANPPSDPFALPGSAAPTSRAGSGTPPPGVMGFASQNSTAPMRGGRRPPPTDIGITTAASADASFEFVNEAMKSAKK